MLANTITLTRTFLTFAIITLLGRHRTLNIALIVSIALIFALDAVDGLVARKRNETSETGALLDTLADRIIENTFWIYFTAKGQISVWMPIVVMARGVITDTLQQTHGYPEKGWTHALTRSRISRGLYGAVKMLAFMCLASTRVFKNPLLEEASLILATVAVGFCLLRGLPFFFIRKTSCPPST
ncbi:CDP-alcohol phosphatidyltransferase family protein [Candidatus Poribacteria bacterium]|nr:CDP-alcohol phosphatidyltransferase family protein [Candidatus Poribacteria bacterium]MYG07124.1 CDP-alcohol phosphatidyltransferase family protein [Candidatus Poribacteria bacterium]MYI05848.1 CDP-alcohol phosphatidyltransferase family protein [Gemmatimonadota bacterium]